MRVLLILFFVATLGDYFVEYTITEEFSAPVTVCEKNSCHLSSYSKKTKWQHFYSLEGAFAWINRGQILNCGICYGDDRPKGFEFVKLLKAETLPTSYEKIGERTFFVNEPKEITEDIKEWKLL